MEYRFFHRFGSLRIVAIFCLVASVFKQSREHISLPFFIVILSMRLLTYIHHDCFVFSDGRLNIVFDFFLDPLQGDAPLPRFLETLDRDKPLYVVVSHHHKDHYDRSIFDWSRHFTDIRYILSNDTARFARHILSATSRYAGVKPDPERVSVLAPGDVYEDALLRISAFGSTDIGNSYAVEISGTSLFHAGDLNAWIWKDESSEQEVNEALAAFEKVVGDIAKRFSRFDAMMFPVDSRIGSDWFTGASIMVRRFVAERFFPMHFCLADSDAQLLQRRLDAAAFRNYANQERGEYICLQAPYDCCLF